MIYLRFVDYSHMLHIMPVLLLALFVLLYGIVYFVFLISDYLESNKNDKS